MDDEVVSTFGDDSASGVRILTTLASSRRTRPVPVKIEGMPLRKSVWQTRALIGVMGVGVVSLLASFVMVLNDGRGNADGAVGKTGEDGAAAQQATAQAQTRQATEKVAAPATQAAGDNPLAALIAPPQHGGMAPAPAQAAVIENVMATAAATPETKPVATSPAAALQAPPAQVPPAAKSVPVAAQAGLATPKAPVALATAVLQADSGKAAPVKSVQAAPATPAVAAAPPVAKRQNTRQDDDVALLEAMFAHTRTRPAAPAAGPAAASALSVPEELKRCATLGGAGAATCRARVCVQNPTAAACHQDP